MLEIASTFVPRSLSLSVSLPFPGEAPSTSSEFANTAITLEAPDKAAKQPYDAFLVLDVEATCQEGTDLNWPNEIIEWPVCLLRWRQKDGDDRAKELYTADEFRSFVKPTWRPQLSEFCTALTGISQADVNKAPKFARVLESFKAFLMQNGLIDGDGQRLVHFVWCTDGPFDIRDFVVKQCFISRITMPEWLMGNILDVRRVVKGYLNIQEAASRDQVAQHANQSLFQKRHSFNIPQQLLALSLPAFVGRQHSGIDDTRNIARILTELAKRGVRLEPNTIIYPGRRWRWMGRPGQILEKYCQC